MAAAMVAAEARATEVMSLASSGSSNGGDGTTSDILDAFLPWYADVVDVRSNNDGNSVPVFNRGNIDGGVANFDNGVRHKCGVSNNGGERGATQAAAVGRGGAATAMTRTTTTTRMHRNYINITNCNTC